MLGAPENAEPCEDERDDRQVEGGGDEAARSRQQIICPGNTDYIADYMTWKHRLCSILYDLVTLVLVNYMTREHWY